MYILFKEEKYYGKFTYEGEKTYDLSEKEGFAARWLKRGCVEVKPEDVNGVVYEDVQFGNAIIVEAKEIKEEEIKEEEIKEEEIKEEVAVEEKKVEVKKPGKKQNKKVSKKKTKK